MGSEAHATRRSYSFGRRSDQPANNLGHMLDVRTFPIDLAAVRTTVKFAVEAPRQRFEAIPDLFPVDALDPAVAFEAASQRPRQCAEIEAGYHFAQLGVGVVRTHPESVGYGLTKQQAPIAGQNYAPFGSG